MTKQQFLFTKSSVRLERARFYDFLLIIFNSNYNKLDVESHSRLARRRISNGLTIIRRKQKTRFRWGLHIALFGSERSGERVFLRPIDEK